MSPVEIAELIAGAVAVLVLLEGARSLLRRTVGRRRDRYARLARLGTGAQLGFFEAILGQPAAMKRSRKIELDWYEDAGDVMGRRQLICTESFFVEPDHYVQAFCDEDETVLAFSVTARKPRFTPTFTAPRPLALREQIRLWRVYREWSRPLLRVRLNRTRFAYADHAFRHEDASERSVRARVWIGARAWTYSEAHSYGNPGHYQTFVLTASSAAPPRRIDHEALHAIADPRKEGFDDGAASLTSDGRRFRRETVATTYTVLGPSMPLDTYSGQLTFGPHGDEVRTIP